MVVVPKIITNKTIINSFKTPSIVMGSGSRAGAKMGKVTAETTFQNIGAGSKLSFGGVGVVSKLKDLSKPFNTIKKVVR